MTEQWTAAQFKAYNSKSAAPKKKPKPKPISDAVPPFKYEGGIVTLQVEPMSVNRAWQGRRFKTKDYLAYEKKLLLALKPIELCLPPFKVSYVFGFSNPASDLDNPCKLATDILQKKYGFNDKDIYEMNIKKVIVSKGSEFIQLEITHYEIR